MDAVITLLSVCVGSASTIIGQYMLERHNMKTREFDMYVSDECSAVAMDIHKCISDKQFDLAKLHLQKFCELSAIRKMNISDQLRYNKRK